ncbi:MAG: cystathionine gamma-lyase [Pseudomonadota bacterium]
MKFDPSLSPAERISEVLHHRAARFQKGDAAAPPITPTTTFHLPGEPDGSDYYARDGLPVWREVEDQLAVLEQAPVVSFPSGMAALAAAVYPLVETGDRVIIPSDGYFAFRALMATWLAPLGIDTIEVPTLEMANADFSGAKLVFIETPSNPGLDVCDIQTVAEKAHAAGALLVADNTTATALLQRPLDLGADIVVAADTKAMSGHSDVLFGHLASRDEDIIAKVRNWRKLAGNVPGPFEAWLVHRGIETVDVRLERMCRSAQTLSERFSEHPAIRSVRFPGLPSDPSYDLAKKQMDQPGFLIGLEFENKSAAGQFMDSCNRLYQTTSFGGVHSSAERRIRWGDDVSDGFVRFSTGIEPITSLWPAIEDALASLTP